MLAWLKTVQGMLATFAAALAILATWWQLGLPRGGVLGRARGDSCSGGALRRRRSAGIITVTGLSKPHHRSHIRFRRESIGGSAPWRHPRASWRS
jgi:hypothetical protein